MTHEKLEEAKRLYQTANQDQRYVLESLFPELVESEDERIRKNIITYLKQRRDRSSSIPAAIGSWIAWLEKQGEQKSQRMISAMAKEAMYDKPTWSEEDENVLKDIEEAIINYWHGDTQDLLLDWLKSLKNRVIPQQKQEWSEEDEAHINGIIDYLLDYKLFVYEEDMNVANGVQKELDWLNSLKQRIGG